MKRNVFQRLHDKALKLARVWWRPCLAWSTGGSIFVNGILLPIWRGYNIDLVGLAAVITAGATMYGIREWGKTKGADDAVA